MRITRESRVSGIFIENMTNPALAQQIARETGVLRCIELTVRCDNDRAIRLYERFGFRTCGRCTDFFRVRGAYYDACIMELML